MGLIKSREEMFITSKLASIDHDPVHIRAMVKHQVTQMNLDYIDLFLIHAPWGQQILSDEERAAYGVRPKYENGKPVANSFDHMTMWRELEKCVDEGLVHHLGISNFDN